MSALSSLAFSFYSDFYQLRVPLEAGEGVRAPPRLDLKPTVGEGGASLFSCYRKLAGKSQTVTDGHDAVQSRALFFTTVDTETQSGGVPCPTRTISSLHCSFKHVASPHLRKTAASGTEEP